MKLSDYPFAYSFIGLLLFITGHRIIDPKNFNITTFLPLITLIGILATTLSITDPFGNLARFVLGREIYSERRMAFWFMETPAAEHVFRRRLQSDPREYFYQTRKTAISTIWMSYHIDKIVSINYFLIILILIFVGLNYQIFFNSLFSTFIPENGNCIGTKCNPVHIDNNLKLVLSILVSIGAASVGVISYRSIIKLSDYNRIISICLCSQEILIPSLNDAKDNVSGEVNKSLAEIKIKDIENTQQQLINALNNRDWGMSRFFASALATSAVSVARTIVIMLDREETAKTGTNVAS